MSLSQIVEANGPFFTVVFSLLSLASVTIVVWKLWLNHNAKTDLADFLARLEDELAKGGLPAAVQMCEEEPGIVPKVFVTALQTGNQGKVATRDAISNLVELDIIPDLNFLLPLILVFSKLAPMLGLLGTVYGMILAFGKIAGATKVEPSALANDIGMALFTTAEGLLIAIPLIFCYTMFREKVNHFELDLQRAAQAAMNLAPRVFGQKWFAGARSMAPETMDLKVVALDRVYANLPRESLLQWAMEGRIAPTDLVRASGAQDWILVTKVPWLSGTLPTGVLREPLTVGEDDAEQEIDATANWVATRKKRKHEEAEMDMTPMIDVTFQLLIFFMLTNQLANPAPLAVPEAAHGRGISPEGKQMILIDEAGRYYLGDRVDPEKVAKSLDGLIDEVRANASAASGPMDVIVTAHKASKHVQVRELVERLGNVSNVGGVMLGVEEKR